MKQHSAGILLYRFRDDQSEVLIVHPGGPYFANKDEAVWSVPKGMYKPEEEALDAAKREFEEETGFAPPEGEYLDLGEITRRDKTQIKVWAVQGDLDAASISSNNFKIQWPPKSGLYQEFPEIDRAAWLSLAEASIKLHPPQIAFIERLADLLHVPFGPEEPPVQPAQPSLF